MDTLIDRIKNVALEKGITTNAELERLAGLNRQTIRNWDKTSPSIDKVEKVASVLDVSVDYLLGRTDEPKPYWELSRGDEETIERDLEMILENMDKSTGYAAFDGSDPDDLDEETQELLRNALEQSLRIAKMNAKRKFTPKKHLE